MAALAQNESKKTSMRVKAGQMVSFQNGVIYGTGNVLGYDKVGQEYVINEAQARTVRKIFDMYLAGTPLRKPGGTARKTSPPTPINAMTR